MKMIEKKYYVMQYSAADEGCPASLAGFFNHDKFEWAPYELDPKKIDIKKEYRLKLSALDMKLDALDFDFYQVSTTYVSRNFLEVCDALNASYRAIPLEISLGGKSRNNEFFIFLPGESLAALDKVNSVYEISKDIETGRIVDSPLYPGAVSISRIDRFVVSEDVESDIFRCQETLELFCSERFRLAATGLKGVSFLEVDDTYRYDPWAGLDDI
jgi:hypothetical protein